MTFIRNKAVTKILSQPLLRINGVLLPTPRSQVTIFNKHEKLFFEIVPCDSELITDFTFFFSYILSGA